MKKRKKRKSHKKEYYQMTEAEKLEQEILFSNIFDSFKEDFKAQTLDRETAKLFHADDGWYGKSVSAFLFEKLPNNQVKLFDFTHSKLEELCEHAYTFDDKFSFKKYELKDSPYFLYKGVLYGNSKRIRLYCSFVWRVLFI